MFSVLASISLFSWLYYKTYKFLLQDPKILDSSSQSQDIIHYLEVLIEKMDSLNNLALTYKSHQKNFKVFNKDHELIAFSGLYNITRLLGTFLSFKLA